MNSLADFVGLPYAQPHDCYGLVRAALASLAGITLPEKQYGTDPDERAALLASGLPGWPRVGRSARWDVVVIKRDGRPAHVGLCIGGDRFLHVMEGGTSRIDRFGPMWAVEGFYRHEPADSSPPSV